MKNTINEHPVMYKGFIIRKGKSNVNLKSNDCLCAYSYANDIFINPLYKTWKDLKLVIDNTHCMVSL